jgi:hypothetical protein
LAAEFQPEQLYRKRLVIAATDKQAVNAWVAHQAESQNIPVNVVDDRELSRFIVPAIVDRSPVVVAVGSSGDAPVLTRRLREKLEGFLPERLGVLARVAGKLRATVKRRIADASGKNSSTAPLHPTCWRGAFTNRNRNSSGALPIPWRRLRIAGQCLVKWCWSAPAPEIPDC